MFKKLRFFVIILILLVGLSSPLSALEVVDGVETNNTHNSLSGIQGGAATDYYHITAAQAAIVGNTSGANTGDNTVATSGDAAVDFFGAGVTAVTDATTCTDIEGTGLSITTGVLNAADASATNEINTITCPDAEATEGLGITFADTGIMTITEAADTITFDATEVDSVVGAVTGIVKADGGGNISAATADTDYLVNVSGDSTPDLGGKLTVGENDIFYDEALSADGTYSGDTFAGVMGDTLAFGDLVYLASADGRWEKTDNGAENTSADVMLAIVITGGNDGDTGLLMSRGFIREDDWNFTTAGKALYVDATAGAMSQTATTTSTEIVRIVGFAHDNADTIYFNPGTAWVTYP